MTVQCTHCGKVYKTEGKHFKNHEQNCPIAFRKRLLETPHGYNAFIHWQYDRRFFNSNSNTKEKFIQSRDFLIYAETSIWLFERKCPDLESFTRFVSDNQINYRYWRTDETYAKWMSYFYRTVDIATSFTMSLDTVQLWTEKYGGSWKTFLTDARPETILHYLESYKLSPWFIYILNGYKTIEARCEEPQKKMLKLYADPATWVGLVVKHKEDIQIISNIMENQ